MTSPDNAAVAEAAFGESYKGVIEIGPDGETQVITGLLAPGGPSHVGLAATHWGPIREGAIRVGFGKSGDYLDVDSGLPWQNTITCKTITMIRQVLQERGFLDRVDVNRTLIRIQAGDIQGTFNLNGILIRADV